MKDNLRKDLLQRRMTRKEFLGILGGSMLVLLGFGRFMTLLQHNAQPKEAPQGFGSKRFGG
jgi:hypothetical protein